MCKTSPTRRREKLVTFFLRFVFIQRNVYPVWFICDIRRERVEYFADYVRNVAEEKGKPDSQGLAFLNRWLFRGQTIIILELKVKWTLKTFDDWRVIFVYRWQKFWEFFYWAEQNAVDVELCIITFQKKKNCVDILRISKNYTILYIIA